jgi:hypothetical protein
MLYLITIHWQRRVLEEGRPSSGKSTYPTAARNYPTAVCKAKLKFQRKFGAHLTITKTEEFQDPARVFHDPVTSEDFPIIDCGSGRDFGVCPRCGLGHGAVLMMAGRSLVSSPEN